MKPRKMAPRVMWAMLKANGKCLGIYDTRALARSMAATWTKDPPRVVRVRVTEAT